MNDYQHYFNYALDEYCRLHSPCTFENSKGRCVNSRSTHESKGHQNAKGKIIATGRYQSSFTYGGYYHIWANGLDRDILKCQNELQALRDQADETVSDETHPLNLHKREMNNFYRNVGTAKDFQSHAVCFSCLMGIPEHSLPCGHILCTACIKGYGRRGRTSNSSEFSLASCPLHLDECHWTEPCVFRFKPDLAGVRVLSLDG
jgi:hypothetical protein